MNIDSFFLLAEHHPWLLPVLIVVASFILEDPTTIAVGLMISAHRISFSEGLLSLATGIFLGDLGLYVLGVGIKRGFFKSKKSFLSPRAVTIGLARFIPGMRTITFLSAGFSRYPLRAFLLISFPSAVISSVLLLVFTKEIMGLLQGVPPSYVWVGGTVLFFSLQYAEKKFRPRQ